MQVINFIINSSTVKHRPTWELSRLVDNWPNNIDREERNDAKSIKLQTDYLFARNVQNIVKHRHFSNGSSF